MSLRAMRGLLFSSLVLGLTAVGCGDGDGNDNDGKKDASVDGGADAATDAGMDSSSADAAGGDGGADDPGDPGSCEGAMLVSSKVRACQIPAAQGGGCGLWSNDILAVNSSAKFPENTCLPKDAPGAASTHCGQFLDQVEPDMMAAAGQPAIDNTALHMNGGLDIPSPLGPLTFSGCCTPQGECGANLRSPTAPAQYAGLLDLHLGCMGLQALQESLGGGSSGGTPRPAPTLVPYCNPTSGGVECPAKLGLLCEGIKMRNPAVECTADTATPSWVCATLGLPRNGQPVAVTEECLVGLPSAAQGCGTPTVPEGARCIGNVPADKFGCGARLPANAGPAFPDVPKMVCGCGENKGPSDLAKPTCIPNQPTSVCGNRAPTAAELAGVSNAVCGCGETLRADGRPCLSYLPKETCGTLDTDTDLLPIFPKNLCGCGATITYDPANTAAFPVPCLSKREISDCGGGPIRITDPNGTPGDADDCFTGVPAYVRGCGPDATAPAYPPSCISHGETTVFGCTQPAAGKVVPQQPTFACGCGAGVKTGAGCVPNVATDVCGTVPSAPTTTLPTFLCGCGEEVVAQPSGQTRKPCLSYTPLASCGGNSAPTPAQVGFPNICGCGTEQTYNPATATSVCISKLDTTANCPSGG